MTLLSTTVTVLIQNDAVLLGILLGLLALIFHTASLPRFAGFYRYVPTVLLCYFLPSLLSITWGEGQDWAFRAVDPGQSQLYMVASRYLLPASLVFFTLGIDLAAIAKLGFKAVAMFLAGTLGVILGGPVALLVVGSLFPETLGVGSDALWRGLATIAGSWIGGSANQVAMKEIFGASDQLFSQMIAVDILTGNLWLAVLLYGAGIHRYIDRKLKADSSSIEAVQRQVEAYQATVARLPTLTDWVKLSATGFGLVGLAYWMADGITPYIKAHYPSLERFSLTSGFFWVVVLATTFGLLASISSLRRLEGAGASKLGSLLLYILVATIGLQMDLTAIFKAPVLFLIGAVWMLTHISVLLLVAWLIRAPFFFVAVGSQANVGGAASAPIIATAFHPSLAPVGVLLAVLGYAVGTYGAWLCAVMMQAASGGV